MSSKLTASPVADLDQGGYRPAGLPVALVALLERRRLPALDDPHVAVEEAEVPALG